MHTHVHSRARAWVAAVLAAGVVAVGAITAATAANAAPVNLSQGKTATASSTENADYTPARNAVDGNAATRWASLAGRPADLPGRPRPDRRRSTT